MKRCKVITEHKSKFPVPLVARAGEAVQIGRSDDEFPGWVWCTGKAGIEAWVPENYLRIDGSSGEFIRDYNSFEMTVETGVELEVLDEASGWLWCRKADGSMGWIPSDKVRIDG